MTALICVLLNAGCHRGAGEPAHSVSSETESLPGETGSSRTGRNDSPESTFLFADVAADRHVNFEYSNGLTDHNRSIVLSLGGGAGMIDYDADGDQDILFSGGGQFAKDHAITGRPSGLFRNQSPSSEGFQDVTGPAVVGASRFYSHGVAVGDFDNDGFRDFLITGFGGLSFYQNLGDGTFTEIAQAAGLTDSLWSSSAAFGDFNRDGALDLYVAHYVNWSFENDPECPGVTPGSREICPPRRFDGLPDTLYLSRADGTFRDASEEWGLLPDGKGLGVIVGDVDLDGDSDVYVANDTVPNFLYLNSGSRFDEAGLLSGTSLGDDGRSLGSMGVDLGDFDRDGLPDLWVVNYESEGFELYHNEGNGFFVPMGRPLGITAAAGLFVGWGTALVDLDHDTDLDMLVSNGHVVLYPTNAPVRQLPLLFANQNGQRFENVAPSVGGYFSTPHLGRGLAVGDLDNDGDYDFVVSSINEPVALLENRTRTDNHWIGVRLIGRFSPRDPVGAVVTVELANGTKLIEQFKGGTSYASSNDPRIFLGLGQGNQVAAVSIRWPHGTTDVIKQPELDRVHTIVETR